MNHVARVCIVRHYYYPEELSTRRQAEYFAGLGYQVDVICSRRSSVERLRERVNGVNVFRMPISHQRKGVAWYLVEYTAFFLMAAALLFWLHLRNRYDVVQVNTMPDLLAFVTLLPRLLGAKVVVFMQEPMPEIWVTKMGLDATWKRLVYCLLVRSEQLTLRYAQRVLTVTEQLKETYVSRGAQADKITVILNVPDTGLFKPLPARATPDKATFDLTCHGAIEKRYGQDIALRAVALLKDEIPGLRLNVLGRGEYEPELTALTRELGLEERVRFWGFVSLEQLIQLLGASDVGLVPVRRNVYSDMVHTNKMFEFMAMDKPVIISRTRAVEAYFKDSCLKLFEPGDELDLARAILELYRSPDRGRNMAKNARRAYEAYQWDIERIKCLRVFEELLEGTPSRRSDVRDRTLSRL